MPHERRLLKRTNILAFDSHIFVYWLTCSENLKIAILFLSVRINDGPNTRRYALNLDGEDLCPARHSEHSRCDDGDFKFPDGSHGYAPYSPSPLQSPHSPAAPPPTTTRLRAI